MTNNSIVEIRKAFLDFFYNKGHQIVAGSSLVPDNDPTLLFTNAGMNQFKNVFLGLEKRNYTSATTSQRCVRAGGKHNDLEKVGYTTRHHTFFEMLGNFSFGEYFKHKAIQYAWELLTDKNWFNLLKERLWITVYSSDNESYEIWEKEIGVPKEHIIRIGDNKGISYSSDNFWKISDTGLCGPCTEIFYDRGDHVSGLLPGKDTGDSDRYVEIWNIVFLQFNRHSDGTMELLSSPSVDTGMGLERIAAVLQHVDSNYEIDLFRKLIASVAQIIGTTDLSNKSLRVIADHIRSCAFLIVDGVIPSNENRGYVLRRIIRRAVRHGNMVSARKGVFFYKLVEPLIEVMGAGGEDLKFQQKLVEDVLKKEEEQFSRTLEHGLWLLNKELENLSKNTLNGEIAFRLYDTYGFPIDLTKEICRERNIIVDETSFYSAMEVQRNRTKKSGSLNRNYNAIIHHIDNSTDFQDEQCLKLQSNVASIVIDGKIVNCINKGQEAVVFLYRTPFYAESGGQIGDRGELIGEDFRFVVNDSRKYGRAIGHIGRITFGCLKVEDCVEANIDEKHRAAICLNHSATHLMYAALRKVLGTHVIQKGSLVNEKILRFDFLHFTAMKYSEIRAVENLVNEQIRRNLLIERQIMDFEVTKKKGIISLFNERYDKDVRVLSIGDFSIELCCGTHAFRTGDIGLFRIVSESSIAAGIRRVKAVTGEKALASLHAQSDVIYNLEKLLKVSDWNIEKKIQDILGHTRKLIKESQKLKERIIALEALNLCGTQVLDLKGVKLLVKEVVYIEPNMLRSLIDKLKNQLGSSIIVLATIVKNRVYLVVRISKDIRNRIKTEELINMIAQKINGTGGDFQDVVQISGTNVDLLPEALTNIEDWINKKLQ